MKVKNSYDQSTMEINAWLYDSSYDAISSQSECVVLCAYLFIYYRSLLSGSCLRDIYGLSLDT